MIRTTAALVLTAVVLGVATAPWPASARVAPPAVSAVRPTSGSTAGGATIDVLGSGFTRASRVGFDATPAARVRFVSATHLRVRVPAHRAGVVDVHVRTAAGSSRVSARDRFTFVAPACARVVRHVRGALTANATWSPTCTSAYVLDADVTVARGVTLALAAGTTVLAAHSTALVVNGALRASGTPTAPVTLRAWSDTAGGWDGVSAASGALIALRGVVLRQAATALDVADGATVLVRGRIVDDAVGVHSEDSVVDARFVDWGSASGPAPVGSGTTVAGSGVFVTPWTGWQAPVRPVVNTVSAVPPSDTTCADVLFVGVRGSGEGPQGAAVDTAADRDLLGARVAPVLDAMTRALALSGRATRVLGLRYPAAGGPYTSVSEYDQDYLDSIYAGVDELEDVLPREHSRCPAERIVLAGYSQGALVIRLALAELAAKDELAGLPIAAVELIGDPARRGTGTETRLGGAYRSDEGVWTVIFGDVPLPATLQDATTTFCHRDDDVCDAAVAGAATLNYAARGGPHASYPEGDELDPLGIRAAQRVSV